MEQRSYYEIAIQQVMRVVRNELADKTWPVNPFPRGMKAGCGTERVYIALVASIPRWLEHHEVMRMADCSRGMADWGLRYLIERGMVRAIESASRPGYLRYQAIKRDGDEAE